MSDKLLEIRPPELKFSFELRKRCSCTVQLVNNTDQYVAFKVKATSPNKYNVRPNIDILQPKSICDFTVIMEALQVAPTGLKCKDKFLIQSTIVSFGTNKEQISPGLFRKDNGRHIDESKLRVVLVTPLHSPACDSEASKETSHRGSKSADPETNGVENHSPLPMFRKDNGRHIDESKLRAVLVTPPHSPACDSEASEAPSREGPKSVDPETNGVEIFSPPPVDLRQLDEMKLKLAHDLDDGNVAGSEEKYKLTKDVEELKSKLRKLESNLNEVEAAISMLRGDGNIATKDGQTLKQEFEISKTGASVKEVEVGFSFLFVCMAILISLELGYELLRFTTKRTS